MTKITANRRLFKSVVIGKTSAWESIPQSRGLKEDAYRVTGTFDSDRVGNIMVKSRLIQATIVGIAEASTWQSIHRAVVRR